jgi:hypothetical protein
VSDDQVCLLEHKVDSDRPRRVYVGFLCRGHAEGLWRTLDELSSFAAQADEASYDETVSIATGGAPVSGSREKPLPVNERRVDHVIAVRGVLASWSQLFAEERGVAVPDSPEPRVTSGFLRRHLDWACGRDWIDDFANEVFELGRRAYSLLNPSGIRRIEIGPCREPQCDGQLSALVRKTDDVLPSSICCSSCGVEITADQWLTYGRRVRDAA